MQGKYLVHQTSRTLRAGHLLFMGGTLSWRQKAMLREQAYGSSICGKASMTKNCIHPLRKFGDIAGVTNAVSEQPADRKLESGWAGP